MVMIETKAVPCVHAIWYSPGSIFIQGVHQCGQSCALTSCGRSLRKTTEAFRDRLWSARFPIRSFIHQRPNHRFVRRAPEFIACFPSCLTVRPKVSLASMSPLLTVNELSCCDRRELTSQSKVTGLQVIPSPILRILDRKDSDSRSRVGSTKPKTLPLTLFELVSGRWSARANQWSWLKHKTVHVHFNQYMARPLRVLQINGLARGTRTPCPACRPQP